MQEDKSAIFQMRFPQKLWYLLNLRTDAILWGSTGRTILLNYRVLHNYLQCDHSIFKTTNISSFIRQLNLYGFRKVTSHLQDLLCNSKNPYMHEYVHDYFQYGRPELLNKISRKALAMKRSFRPKILSNNAEQTLYLTPLQIARRALRIALKKAAQDLYMQNSQKPFCNFKSDCDPYKYYMGLNVSQDDYYDVEDITEMDWCLPNSDPTPDHPIPDTDTAAYFSSNDTKKEWVDYEQSQDLVNITGESSHNNNEGYPAQLLSIPDLDPEPLDSKSNVDLLAEFGINNTVDAGIIRNVEKENDHNSLNCVLPSISSDHNYDVSMIDKNNETSDNFNGEWDQMFNDFIPTRGPNQECGSDLKELYSHISKSIDLFNC